jgi:hypothetical protein
LLNLQLPLVRPHLGSVITRSERKLAPDGVSVDWLLSLSTVILRLVYTVTSCGLNVSPSDSYLGLPHQGQDIKKWYFQPGEIVYETPISIITRAK